MNLAATLVCEVLAVVGLWIVALEKLYGVVDGYSKSDKQKNFRIDDRFDSFHVLVPLHKPCAVAAHASSACNHPASVASDTSSVAVISPCVSFHPIRSVLHTSPEIPKVIAGHSTAESRGDSQEKCDQSFHQSLPTKAPSLRVHYSMNLGGVNG